MEHKMIPAYGCESGGAPVKPANTCDKVLVSPISEPTESKRAFCITSGVKDWAVGFSIACKHSHFLQLSVHNSEGAVVAGGGQQSITGMTEASKRWFYRHFMWDFDTLNITSPVCGEGEAVHSAAVDCLHPGRFGSQEIFYGHSAQLITWNTTFVWKCGTTTLPVIDLPLGLTKSNGASVVGVPSNGGSRATRGLNICIKTEVTSSWGLQLCGTLLRLLSWRKFRSCCCWSHTSQRKINTRDPVVTKTRQLIASVIIPLNLTMNF